MKIKNKLKNNNKGFTLIELLVVIAIIGILSSIVLSSLSSARARARDAERLAEMKNIEKALAIYALNNNGRIPMSTYNSWSNISTITTNGVIDCNAVYNASNGVNDLYDTLIAAKALSAKPTRDMVMEAKGYCYVYITDGTWVSVLGATYDQDGALLSGKPIAAVITNKVKNAVFFSALENTKTVGGYKALVGISVGSSVPLQLNVDLTTGITNNTVYSY